MKCITLFLALILAFCLSCDKRDATSSVNKRVVVYFSPEGLGDFGYNDDIMRGVQLSTLDSDFDLSIVVPDDLEEAERLILEEANKESPTPKLIVLCTDIYENIAKEMTSLANHEKLAVLIFETDKPVSSTYTFTINNYEASYLAGSLTAAFKQDVSILCANPHDKPISKSKEGFMAGFKSKACINSPEIETHYLSDNAGEGYSSTADAYALSRQIYKQNDVIFPLLGGAALGVYRYTREFDSTYVVGMDRDQESFSDGVFISLVKRMDLLVRDHITKWVNDEYMEFHHVYGLESEYVDVVISSAFQQLLDDKYDSYKQEAINNGRVK